ncbi:MAG: MBL fold metallo-hydrolase [Acidobacteriota bacterium]|nr:MBL fold metallo-hydrolase [Acidobacteriota bacterium]
MIHEILTVGPLQCNCSILGEELSHEAIVVDPGDEIARITAVLRQHALTVKYIVITHAHIDHIAGAAKLKQLTGAPILYNHADLPLVAMMDIQAGWLGIGTPEVPPPDDTLDDGKRIVIGTSPETPEAGLSGTILHTPGHTEGSVCLYLPAQNLLIAGDTLFRNSIGRTDLPGGNTRKLLTSIHERLLTLPDDVVVIPGHGSRTSVGQERDSNPFLQKI